MPDPSPHPENAASQPAPSAELPAAYLGFFECFNRGDYFEAHEVLEEHWLDYRSNREGNFFKALIQYAGVFVHLERGRPAPAAGLCRSALRYLTPYRPRFMRLDVDRLCEQIAALLERIESGETPAWFLAREDQPRLALEPPTPTRD
ncbi:MAG: DUF309 domain-containing protein [Verrucomicrobia bacterium]|nr:MAG: DUF309 domain-containing protein [Verrucomicrobiota bacterium]